MPPTRVAPTGLPRPRLSFIWIGIHWNIPFALNSYLCISTPQKLLLHKLHAMPPYDPQRHNRKSIRLKGYDYSQSGLYFITICCQDRKHRFGHVAQGQMILNEYGQIAHDQWFKLPTRFPHIELDAFQVMPNHIHGIIVLVNVGATLAVAPTDGNAHPDDDARARHHYDAHLKIDDRATARVAQTVAPTVAPTTIGDIVGAYKSLVSNACLDIYKQKNRTMGKLWQRNYHEHIIRNDRAYQNIQRYIHDNPSKWDEDTVSPK